MAVIFVIVLRLRLQHFRHPVVSPDEAGQELVQPLVEDVLHRALRGILELLEPHAQAADYRPVGEDERLRRGHRDLARAQALLEDRRDDIGFNRIITDSKIAKISVVGVGMRFL
mgnify:CR=1 FL=1